MKIFDPKPHPLKKELRSKKIKLYQARPLIDNLVTEGRLSRMLNGIDPMPEEIESKLISRLRKL